MCCEVKRWNEILKSFAETLTVRPKCGAEVGALPPLGFCSRMQELHNANMCTCVTHIQFCTNALTHLSQQFSYPPTHTHTNIFLERILSVSCCLLSFLRCHRLRHLAPVLPHPHRAAFRDAFHALVNAKHKSVTE